MAGQWRGVAGKKSFAGGRCTCRRVWARVWPGTLDGHARGDPGAIDGVVDSAGDRPFVPEGFSVDAAARTNRGCVLLAAGPRTASRGERAKIFFAWITPAASGIPAIVAGGGDFSFGRFFAYTAESVFDEKALAEY